jgi:hypothetical protein
MRPKSAPSPAPPPPKQKNDPTPDQRAELIVLKLEHYIRDNRTVRGVPYRTWQAMARAELTQAFIAVAEREQQIRRDVVMRRFLTIVAGSLITIGFWGAVVALDTHYATLSAILMFLAGLGLLYAISDFSIRRFWSSGAPRRRRRTFRRIETFDRQIRRLERDLQKHLKKKEEEAKQQMEEETKA